MKVPIQDTPSQTLEVMGP